MGAGDFGLVASSLGIGGMGKRMKLHKAGLFLMVLVLAVGWVKAVWAQDDDLEQENEGTKQSDFIKERSYVGILGTSADIDQWGDFNGTQDFGFYNPGVTVVSGGTTTVAPTEIDLVPSITRQFGWGVLVGHRQGPWAAEVSFWRSDHTGSYIFPGPVTTTFPSSLQAINIDFKRYFFTAFPTQPFINIGLSFPWLYVQNASYVWNSGTSSYSSNNETISGIGFELGAGIELYLDQNFSILGGLYERWSEFDQINGASKIPLNELSFDGNTSDKGALAGNGLQLYVGTTFGVE